MSITKCEMCNNDLKHNEIEFEICIDCVLKYYPEEFEQYKKKKCI